MPVFERGDARIHYEVFGAGSPVLLIAPGGMRSSIEAWSRLPFSFIEALASDFQVIAMDQRNAGKSSAPIQQTDGWDVYTEDQLALMDHLGISQFSVVGMCIGGAYIMGLIRAAESRVSAAVMLQPIGLERNREKFFELFDSWAAELAPSHPEADQATWAAFREAMFGGDFLFNATRQDVERCTTPLLVLLGSDIYHPEVISRDIARFAQNARLVERWKDPEHIASAMAEIKQFLAEN